jgi:Fe-S-cluster containining protein
MTFGGCATCVGDCCRRYLVPVTVADVFRIVKATALHPREFLQLIEHAVPPLGFQLRRGGDQLYLMLDRRATGACVFLVELPSGQARCGAYQYRPSACRTFPTSLRHGTPTIRTGISCGPGAWCLATMDLACYRQDLTEQRVAWQAHLQVVADWNAHIVADRTAEDLFTFLLEQQPVRTER